MPPILALLRSRSKLILIALVMLCIAGLWLRGNHYQASRDLWRSTAKTQAEATRTAMAAAALRAETARLQTQRRYAAHARKADYEEPRSVSDLRAGADQYAVAHRLRTQADCRLPRNSDSAAQDSPAPDRDGPGPDPLERYGVADTIAIPRRRYDELVENTLRLAKVRIWGDGLIKDGLAVPSEDFAASLPEPRY